MNIAPLDAIIVGAGYAGLIAARDLSEAGFSVRILEASDRIGGRVWSKPFQGTGFVVDWGAEWILPAHHHALMAEAARYGVGLDAATVDAASRWLAHDATFAGTYFDLKAARPGFAALLSRLEQRAIAYGADAGAAEETASLAESLYGQRSDPTDAALVDAALFPLTGADPARLSCAAIWNEVRFHGGSLDETIEPETICRLEGGAAEIARRIAHELSPLITLGARVDAVSRTDTGVTVSGGFGELSARAVVLALPLAVLHALDLSPPLEQDQAILSREGNVGRTAKLWALVEGEGVPDFCFLTGHSVRLTYARSVGDGRYLICAQALIDELADQSEAGLRDVFERLYPEHRVVAVELVDWTANEFARASWFAAGIGAAKAVPARFNQPGPILFAGGDFADPWCGWIEGAIRSGTQVARAIIGSGHAPLKPPAPALLRQSRVL